MKTLFALVLLVFGCMSASQAAAPDHFEIEVGIVVGTNEVEKFRGDTLTVSDLLKRSKKYGRSTAGMSCFPDGNDNKFTAFDVVSDGKITQTTKGYGGKESSTLQKMCLTHHIKYHGQ